MSFYSLGKVFSELLGGGEDEMAGETAEDLANSELL